MKIKQRELNKILKYILLSDLDISNGSIFDKSFLRNFALILDSDLKGKIKSNFITKKHIKQIKESFINSKNVINDDTPYIIASDAECIKASFERDNQSIRYLNYIPESLNQYFLDYCKKNKVILNESSPKYFISNYDIILNSIKLNVNSANYIDWNNKLTLEEEEKLIDEIVSLGYVLSKDSCLYLRRKKKIIMASIKKDVDTIDYARWYENDDEDDEIFKCLITHGRKFQISDLKLKKFKSINSKDVLSACIYFVDGYDSDDACYKERVDNLFVSAINSIPTISQVDQAYKYALEKEWFIYKRNHLELNNIFGKICTNLRNNEDFYDGLADIDGLEEIQDTISKEKYSELYDAMREYHLLYYEEEYDKLEKSKNVIAKIAAHYVAKTKENYKKKELEGFHNELKRFFKLRKDHPMIIKKLVEKHKKQKFYDMLVDEDNEIVNFIHELYEEYFSEFISSETFEYLVGEFLSFNEDKLEDELAKPYWYDEYLLSKKCKKIINRLNNGYIKYDGLEVYQYKNSIEFDEQIKKYVYTGRVFDDEELEKFERYSRYLRNVKKVKKEIMLKIKTLKLDKEIDDEEIIDLRNDFPLTDEYFEFNNERWLSDFKFEDIVELFLYDDLHYDCIADSNTYELIYDFFINKGMFWVVLFCHEIREYYDTSYLSSDLLSNGLGKNAVNLLINNMSKIYEVANQMNYRINSIDDYYIINELCNCSTIESLNIVGADLLFKLCTDLEYTDGDKKAIVESTKNLICKMAKKDKSTVPYVSGETLNYKYSIYDSLDTDIFESGINTDSCFRIKGNDNDFLHYCATDKNGFAIKITDSYNNFIGRAAGFRNGNCVYINQLRTIYDQCGDSFLGSDDYEKDEIIEVFKKACQDMVEISQSNDQEKDKIEYVFITRSYIYKYHDLSIPSEVIKEIGSNPMDNSSYDWDDFISMNRLDLDESLESNYFYTDYGDYPIVLVAGIKKTYDLVPADIKRKNVEALYERKRNNYIVTDNVNEDIFKKINKINFIYGYYKNENRDVIKIDEGSIVCVGDNWFIIFKDNCIVNSCVLEFDKYAMIEYNSTKQALMNSIENESDNNKIKKMILKL